MPNKSQPLLEQITQNPLLISASAEALFQASVLHVIGSEHAGTMLQAAVSAAANDDDFWPTTKDDWRAAFRPYNVDANGILQIPVMGVLLNRFPYQFGRWATGYTYVEKALQRGMADANVKAIAFVVDSPGGEVAGCFELVDKIYEARGTKPFRAFSADHAYSAAYAISSAANNISVTRSGGVGSIGVVTAHVEYSEMLKDLGIKITFIFAGKHKVDGNPYEKLPESVKSRIQERIDRIYGVFTSTVARNRSMDEKAVRDTNALTYDANEAIEVGLADRVGALDEEMVIFSEEVAATEDEQMAQSTEVKTVDQATHDTAVAAARTEGATAERTRISAILASDEGKVRPKAAMSLAMKTGLTLEEAKATLADMPEEKAETPIPAPAAATPDPKKPAAAGPTPFDAAMNKDNPEVGGGDGSEGANDDEKASTSILADYAGATGLKKKSA
jgi:signal peptide peptidase SppA